MELDKLFRDLKEQISSKDVTLTGLTADMKKMTVTVNSIEDLLGVKGVEERNLVAKKCGEIENKSREVTVLTEKLSSTTEELNSMKSTIAKLEKDKEELKNMAKEQEKIIDNLSKKMAEWEKKVEYKSSLEKSFESLQVKYQAKVDELEKIRRSTSPIGFSVVDIIPQKQAFKPAAASVPGY
jgi:chromosome segregation ATPase